MDTDRWLNTGEAARRLGLTEDALRQRAKKGQIEAHRIGRRLRFRIEDLDALLSPGGEHGVTLDELRAERDRLESRIRELEAVEGER